LHNKVIVFKKLTTMKTNKELQKDTQDAIQWKPLLKATETEVSVKDETVKLLGNDGSYSEKEVTNNVDENVMDIKMWAEKMGVQLDSSWVEKDENDMDNHLKSFSLMYWL
jgi:hypothetical protein